MIRFISTPNDLGLGQPETITVPREAIHTTLESALDHPGATSILVYDRVIIPKTDSDDVKLIISEAMNGSPYVPPQPVTAAGGYVIRVADGGAEVLLILRRGVWDLPKGKLRADETIEEAALREVGEEVGAENLRIVRPLGTTTHGYLDGPRLAVKTTYWFLMETTSQKFRPERAEKIEAVRWVPWAQASEMLGFETLREHMASIRI